MTYSKYFQHQDKKIPLPLTIILVLLIIIFIARFFAKTPLPSRADKKTIKKLTVANLSHNQAGIFWQTNQPEIGWVVYNSDNNKLNITAADERDLQDRKSSYLNHFVMLKNLKPDTIYYYKIISNNQVVEAGKGAPFMFKTASTSLSASNLNPAYGKIISENGIELEGAAVILTFDQAYPLISFSKTTGEWLIPLNPILVKATLKPRQLNPQDKLTVDIFSEDGKKSKIDTNTANISPLPQTIIMGKNFNFLNEGGVLSANSKVQVRTGRVDILFPKQSAVIPGGRPLIKGTAIAGNEVDIKLDSERSYTAKTTVDKDGLWSINVGQTLSPGSYVLKMTTRDANNKKVEITRTFSIAKSGEQVLAAATPDGDLSPTDIPLTEIPTVFLSPTIFETPAITQSATTVLSPPVSGINTVPVSIASVTLIILGLGIFLAF